MEYAPHVLTFRINLHSTVNSRKSTFSFTNIWRINPHPSDLSFQAYVRLHNCDSGAGGHGPRRHTSQGPQGASCKIQYCRRGVRHMHNNSENNVHDKSLIRPVRHRLTEAHKHNFFSSQAQLTYFIAGASGFPSPPPLRAPQESAQHCDSNQRVHHPRSPRLHHHLPRCIHLCEQPHLSENHPPTTILLKISA